MLLHPKTLNADGNPDDASLLAMRAALRDLKVVMPKRKPAPEHPRRAEMLAILTDAKARIERINGGS